LDDGAVLVFDSLDVRAPQHVLFAADGSVLHRTAVGEISSYVFPPQTRDYITASGTAVLQSSSGQRLTAYDRNGARLYDIGVPEQMLNYPALAAVHVLADGSAVLTIDKTESTTATAYAW